MIDSYCQILRKKLTKWSVATPIREAKYQHVITVWVIPYPHGAFRMPCMRRMAKSALCAVFLHSKAIRRHWTGLWCLSLQAYLGAYVMFCCMLIVRVIISGFNTWCPKQSRISLVFSIWKALLDKLHMACLPYRPHPICHTSDYIILIQVCLLFAIKNFINKEKHSLIHFLQRLGKSWLQHVFP